MATLTARALLPFPSLAPPCAWHDSCSAMDCEWHLRVPTVEDLRDMGRLL